MSDSLPERNKQFIKWHFQYQIDIFIFQEHWLMQNFNSVDYLRSKNVSVICIQHSFFLFPFIKNSDKEPNHFILSASINSYKNVQGVVCLSKTDVQLFKAAGVEQTVYIPNPLTFDLTQNISLLINKNVIIVGRLDKLFKQQHLAISAMKKVVQLDKTIQLQIIGDGDKKYTQELHQMVKENQLENNVQFIPFQKNITKFYQNASAMWVTSAMEGFPMVVAEAKVFGLPIIAFDLEYPALWEKGLVKVPPMDVEQLAALTVEILNNKTKMHELQLEALESIQEFHLNQTVQKWKQLIDQIMNKQQITYSSGMETSQAKKIMHNQLKAINVDLFYLFEELHEMI
ncbi:Glycosyl_transferases group 1 family protein [Hexamita inflata]|uniref:Glycosyl_transferases group 1 family protein n=1 Tax=Hexamita inflata TaxID=28002 RepID=A0ABP1HDN8_9EUKA